MGTENETASKRASRWEAEANAFRVALADTIRPLGDSGEIQQQAARLIAEHFDAGRVNFVILESDNNSAVVQQEYVRGMPSAIGEHPIANYEKMLSASHRIVTVENVADDPRLNANERAIYQDLQIGSLVRVQLITKGRIAGALTVANRQARAWSEAEVSLLQEAAERVWAAIERAHVEVALHAANAQLLENDQRKNEFLAMLAHELRNPLAALNSANQLLEMRASDAGVQHCLSIQQRQTNTLNSLVNELLDVSRVTRGTIELKQEQVDLAAVAEWAVESVHPLFGEKRHEIVVTIGREPLLVLGDPVRLEQILVNLLTNAAKYTDPGGKVTLDVTARNGWAEICVQDNGIGIAANTRESIFALFGQAEPGLERSQGGLGIGLTIIKQLVELHGGSIDVYSAGLGHGARFTVMLPLTASAESTQAAGRKIKAAQERRRILVVEDSQDVADTMTLLLQEVGHEVTAVNSGSSALEAVDEFAPDLVLLDIGLPGMNGYEVARRLRRDSPTRNLVLAGLTGYGHESDHKLTAAAGFDAHFVKPVDFGELQAFIDSGVCNAAPLQFKDHDGENAAF